MARIGIGPLKFIPIVDIGRRISVGAFGSTVGGMMWRHSLSVRLDSWLTALQTTCMKNSSKISEQRSWAEAILPAGCPLLVQSVCAAAHHGPCTCDQDTNFLRNVPGRTIRFKGPYWCATVSKECSAVPQPGLEPSLQDAHLMLSVCQGRVIALAVRADH